jgi:hypothetical protein
VPSKTWRESLIREVKESESSRERKKQLSLKLQKSLHNSERNLKCKKREFCSYRRTMLKLKFGRKDMRNLSMSERSLMTISTENYVWRRK